MLSYYFNRIENITKSLSSRKLFIGYDFLIYNVFLFDISNLISEIALIYVNTQKLRIKKQFIQIILNKSSTDILFTNRIRENRKDETQTANQGPHILYNERIHSQRISIRVYLINFIDILSVYITTAGILYVLPNYLSFVMPSLPNCSLKIAQMFYHIIMYNLV